MLNTIKSCVLGFVILGLTFLSAPVLANGSVYKLKEGDAIQISVWGDVAMNKDVKVLPDGSITYPLAGRLSVVGLSTPEIEVLITQKLKPYYPDPQVTVVISGTDGNRVFVVGKVQKPGPVLITRPTTVLQALSLAGNFDKFADTKDIKVIRTNNSGSKVFQVNFDNLLRGQNLESNIILETGDTILVP